MSLPKVRRILAAATLAAILVPALPASAEPAAGSAVHQGISGLWDRAWVWVVDLLGKGSGIDPNGGDQGSGIDPDGGDQASTTNPPLPSNPGGDEGSGIDPNG